METEKVLEQSLMASARMAKLLLDLMERFITWLCTSGVRIIIVLVIAWIAIRLLRTFSARLHKVMCGRLASAERVKRADTIIGMVRTVGVIFITVAATMMMLRETGIDIAPVLATAGIGGLAIGFGAQTLVKDVIAGFFLVVEEQVRIGDVVEVAGKRGVVEGISLRVLRLRDLSGDVHMVPNGAVTVVTNMTRDYSRYLADISVARKEDPDRVFDVVRKIGEELQKDAQIGSDILQPIEVLGIETIGTTTFAVKARLTTRPMAQWRVGREFNRRLKKRFDEVGIAAA